MKEYVYYSFNPFRFTVELYENDELVRRMIVGLDELDSKIQEETLKHLHKDTKWVLELLKRKNIDIEEIFYAFYKDKNIFIIKNSDLL